MADIEELVKNTSFTKAEPGKITFLPEPDRRARQFTIISVDDHIVEPPDTFEGTAPEEVRGSRAPQDRRARRRRVLGVRRYRVPQRRVQRGRRASGRRVQLRADPVRPHAARRVGHPRPHRRHGRQRDLCVAELPVVPPRIRRAAAADHHQGSRAGARRGPGVERLAHRGLGRPVSRTASSRARSRTSSTPRSAPTRSARTRHAGSRR